MTRLVLLNNQSYSLAVGSIIGLDLSSYNDSDYISVACPDFSADIDLSGSYLDLSSNPDGEFSGTGVDSVSFSQTTGSLSGTDVELRFPLSLFSGIDLHNVTGVRFRIDASSDLEFKVMSVRCISADWLYPPLDMNTISEVIEAPVSPTGDPSYPVAFPVEAGVDDITPPEWPVLWQNLNPKALSVSAEISTGSMVGDNVVHLFFRGRNVSQTVLIDNEGKTMANLDGTVPEEGPPLSSSISYLCAEIQWGASGNMIAFGNEDGLLFEFEDIDISPNNKYMFTLTVKDQGVHWLVHKMDLGYMDQLIYDTGIIESPSFVNRLGQFGWLAQLEDGDCAVDNIRSRSANFGDLLTEKFESSTPVSGAQLVETSTPPVELVDSLGTGPFGGEVNSQADGTIKVEGTGKMKGLQTNRFVVTDWAHTLLETELYRDEGKYVSYLLGSNGNIIEVPVADGPAGQWQKIRHRVGPLDDPTGGYVLVFVKVDSNASVWKVRDLSVSTRSISWSARGQSDPWGMSGNQWTPFEDVANTTNGGVTFKEPGHLQVRASMLTGNSAIQEFTAVPKYSELGRFVWDQVPPVTPSHQVSIVTDIDKLRVDFGASIQFSADDDRRPRAYQWGFNDGWRSGKSTRRVFPASGAYSAVLRVLYEDGSVQTAYWNRYLLAS